MQSFDLTDLVMAGVHWELCDVSFVDLINAQKAATAQEKSSAGKKSIDVQEVAISVMNRTPTSVVPPVAPIIPMSADTAASMAARPVDMQALGRMIEGLNHPLKSGASNTVLPFVGDNYNGLVIITDAPSSEDDISGQILTASAGELLDKMLGAINVSRADVAIIPMVFWRTPGGRTASDIELGLTRPFVNRAIELLKPKAVLTLGTLAATHIAQVPFPASQGVEKMLDIGVPCVPIFHPKYLMLKPAAKRDAWAGLQNIQKMLKTD